MAVDYSAKAATAQRMIEAKGMKALLFRPGAGDSFDPITGVLIPGTGSTSEVSCLVLPPSSVAFTLGEKPGEQIRKGEVRLLIAGTASEPAPGDLLTSVTGAKFRIEEVTTLSPAGVNVLYTLKAIKA